MFCCKIYIRYNCDKTFAIKFKIYIRYNCEKYFVIKFILDITVINVRHKFWNMYLLIFFHFF